MDIFQGTISSDYKCRPFMNGDKPAGLLFYQSKSDMLIGVGITIGICFCFLIWYWLNFEAFVASGVVLAVIFFMVVIKGRSEDESGGIKYFLKDILEVKVLDNDTMTSFSKSGASTLAGAAAGGILLGGAGAVVGSIASGNKQLFIAALCWFASFKIQSIPQMPCTKMCKSDLIKTKSWDFCEWLAKWHNSSQLGLNKRQI